jgi:hypothetical protein
MNFTIFLLGITCLFALQGRSYNSCNKSSPSPLKEQCTLLRMDGIFYIIKVTDTLFAKDTLNVLDIGSVGSNCSTGISTVFNDERYNFFREFSVKRFYYDKMRKDSMIAVKDVKLFVFDASINYNNYREIPTALQVYHTFSHNEKPYVLSCRNYIDVKDIWVIKNKTEHIRLEDCYYSIHSLEAQ